MIPLWVGSGPGAEERRDHVAVVVIRRADVSLAPHLARDAVALLALDDNQASQRSRRASARIGVIIARARAGAVGD